MPFTYGQEVTIPSTKGDIGYTQGSDPVKAPPINDNEVFHIMVNNLSNAEDVHIYLQPVYGDDGEKTIDFKVDAGTMQALDRLPSQAVQFLQGLSTSGVQVYLYVWSSVKNASVGGSSASVMMAIDTTKLEKLIEALISEVHNLREQKWTYRKRD
jgi:hypothetical protein